MPPDATGVKCPLRMPRFWGVLSEAGGAPEVGNVIGGLGVFSKGGGAPEVGIDWRFGCFF